ncbi:nonribosomal peptide synthetase 12 [Didymella exigua CBS 183.55]|uniref:Nonribosomal peptide synthetase 12 n=1 Tax=Didymella exigua CBS 183.55 TaxID=1150837 RepID=A0A6A5RN80_9PLEO|nr:nonribosomal peptide synthetase 12 [Didymella exigua CBS 183.55]KAF1929865.1 nonribosomal peptide synthetase 12 [Didymella exigua CBS 183.55]
MAKFKHLEGLSDLALRDQDALSRFGQGAHQLTPHSKVHEAFESKVDANPDALAAVFEDKVLTYQQLDTAANRLSNHLLASGLQPTERVCLVVSRSLEMLIGIFAILKAGCQYVPIDGGVASDKQLAHIFNDTAAHHILCLPRFQSRIEKFAGLGAHVTCLALDAHFEQSPARPFIDCISTDGCYAIYTSGSTGTPKGVDVSHANVTNALLLEPANLGIRLGSKVGSVLSVAFDMGAWEILACLMNGGTLYMRGSRWDATLRQIDTLISTPSILSKYRRADYLNIKTVVTGGEPCPQSLADEWAEGTCFYNICGPTEITILNSAHRHTPGAALSIGKLLPNTTCYILDEYENPVALGEKGSAWVGGAGVTRGYINLPKLTSERYKLDKFRNDGSVMFNTNDIVRWREDGSLETFGRGDDQVKIKGFRVELDGVSATIENYDGISRAAALKIDDGLHAFYAASKPIEEEDLVAAVKHALPYYSIPTRWHFVRAIPLTPNGKVDKIALRDLAAGRRGRADSVTTITTAVPMDSVTSDVGLYPPPLALSHGQSLDFEKESRSVATAISTPTSDSSKSIIDIEKGSVAVEEGFPEVADALPQKRGLHGQRWVRHRAFILYRRFFSVVLMANLAVAGFILHRKIALGQRVLGDLATAAASNLCVAVLMRSEPVVNLLFTVFCSVPTWFPLAIRRHCARIFHIGGIHSGCAIAATVFFTIFTITATVEVATEDSSQSVSTAVLVLSYLIMVLLIAIGSLSHPSIRAKYHNMWETSHRFGGWTALILLWVQIFLASTDLSPNTAPSSAYLHSPPVWLISVATAAVIFPWVHLKKVPVRSEVLSSHAVRLWFDYTTPVVGTAVRLAERPLADWHGFATITNPVTAANPHATGFSLIVSRAGDFTGRQIERAPSHIWVRGIPTCGVLRIATLFRSVVLVATGSGIGPCLAVILAKKVPARILWTAPNPEQTFGKEIVDSVLDTDPHAVIHNTRTMGKPDMSLMAYRLWKESGAEAVCIISNKKFTTKVVYDMEARGIPAYGAIFDS